jgi:DNA-binding response OmpR family regulator
LKGRILVVEDDTDLCEELGEILSEEGLHVDFANSGDLGLEMAHTGNYGLVVLDLRLPGLSGLEVLRALRLHKAAPPVLVVTGHPMSDDLEGLGRDEMKREILSLADGVITKPFDVSNLLSSISNFLP